jgi:hypothetical protein
MCIRYSLLFGLLNGLNGEIEFYQVGLEYGYVHQLLKQCSTFYSYPSSQIHVHHIHILSLCGSFVFQFEEHLSS